MKCRRKKVKQGQKEGSKMSWAKKKAIFQITLLASITKKYNRRAEQKRLLAPDYKNSGLGLVHKTFFANLDLQSLLRNTFCKMEIYK